MVDLHISWEDYNKKTEQLAAMVYKDGWDFNQVVCIAKGGMRVGDIMARIFDVPLAVLSVESYRGDGVKNKRGSIKFSRDLDINKYSLAEYTTWLTGKPRARAPKYLNVLKPFYRIDKSRGQNKSGVGLGLSIVNDIIRSHGGNINFEKSPMNGLRVKVSLPF